MSKVLILLIRAYQYLISPMLAPSCRFTPSCSDYTLESIDAHGASKGVWLGIKRIGRCHPWCHGGFDPVPKK